MKQEISVELGKNSYPILVQRGLLDRVGECLKQWYRGAKIAVVTDTHVDPLYGERLEQSLKGAGYESKRIVVPAGETSKAFENLKGLYSAFLDFSLTRSDLVVALGGGVVGDLTGFAAATFLRGVPFVQVPTSLLAQIDSSVGGKVAVDLPEGKNLAGAFWQPRAVFIDPLLLQTLSDHYFFDGMAEVVKTACIKDEGLFEQLEGCFDRSQLMGCIDEIVARCCTIKKSVVERDERDTGERMLLNFGHTLGHAIEACEHFEGLSHGEAVAAGMVMITQMSEAKGLTQPGTASRIEGLLHRFGLPTEYRKASLEQLLPFVAKDKKKARGSLTLVLLKGVGKGYLYPTAPEFLKETPKG